MRSWFINILLRILFFPSPSVVISQDERILFNQLFESGKASPDKIIDYNLSIPKYKFLQYLTNNKQVLFHGSNNPIIQTFEPREQSLFDGKMDKAVFATKDPIWSAFYAVLCKKSLLGSIRNGSMTANRKQQYHFYSLTEPTLKKNPWTNGTVYLLPEQKFSPISKGPLQFDEWICRETVVPIAKIEVEPSDFYFLNKVACHNETESIIQSWLLYKFRLTFSGRKNVD
jgi:hypothetical protein